MDISIFYYILRSFSFFGNVFLGLFVLVSEALDLGLLRQGRSVDRHSDVTPFSNEFGSVHWDVKAGFELLRE